MSVPTASYSFTMRIALESAPGTFGRVATAIGEAGGNLGAIDIVRVGTGVIWRDVTVSAHDDQHAQQIVDAAAEVEGATIENVSDRTFLMHLGGKLETAPRVAVNSRDDLSMVYTPGVARVCMAIAEDRDRAWNLTMKRHTVAIVSDGSRVLGLGDIGPEAAMPVMEGKALLFKKFAGLDAWPVCVDEHTVDGLVDLVCAIAPAYGGINLEDIRSPECFEIERRLSERLDIPVFHDDKHGTAVAVLAGLLNALRLVGKELADVRIVQVGTGAAGTGVAQLLLQAGARHLVGFDSEGAVHPGRDNPNGSLDWWIEATNQDGFTGSLAEALRGADVAIGLSTAGALAAEDVATMADDAIVFALSNPTPEIMPFEMPGNVRVRATGRSDFPNQINNALVFPGIFAGALEVHARCINTEMKIAAAAAIADMVEPDQLQEDYIIPTPLNPAVAKLVASAVAKAAHDTGVSRRAPAEYATLRLPG